MKARPSLAMIKAWPSQAVVNVFFLPVSKCQSSKEGVSQELKLHHEVAMLKQDCKSSKKGVTQKFKLHHEFTMPNQDCIFHISKALPILKKH